VCANPDVRAPQGARHTDCAGTLAKRYADSGGAVVAMGKPGKRIFEMALCREPAAHPLVCGDTVHTDLVGARAAGLPSVWVVRNRPNVQQLAATLAGARIEPLGLVASLSFCPDEAAAAPSESGGRARHAQSSPAQCAAWEQG
jgi:hypothetical protein